MARQLLVLALVFFAVVGLAAATANAPESEDDNAIGTTDGNTDAAPVGGPVPAGVFPPTPTAPAPAPAQGGSAALEVSAAAGVAAAAVAAVFF
ncbi:hypothetical protein U1Q18_017179 [Sarracenia purpurea var. burkii]